MTKENLGGSDSNYIGINRRERPLSQEKGRKLCSEAVTSNTLESRPNSEFCCGHGIERSPGMGNSGAASPLCAPFRIQDMLMGTWGGYLCITGVWSEKDHAIAIPEETESRYSFWWGADVGGLSTNG